MDLRKKVFLDHIILGPLYWLFNFAFRQLHPLHFRGNAGKASPRTIAICKFVGMGSVVQSMPLIRTLKKEFPQSQIVFITSKELLPFVHRCKDINAILTINDKSLFTIFFSSLALIFSMWRKKIDIYINLEIYSYFSSIIAAMSLADRRFGYFRNSSTYNLGLYTDLIYFNIRVPIRQIYLQMARLLDCKDIQNELVSFNIVQKDVDALNKSLPQLFKNGSKVPYIVINPNASTLRIERRWPAKSYSELINNLVRQFPEFYFVLTGSRNEKNHVEKIFESCGANDHLISAAGKLNINSFLALIDGATLVVTNDSGPMHIAFAQKKNTVALFGPESPRHYGHEKNIIVHYKNLYCSPCVWEFVFPPCQGDNQCMKKIPVDAVFNSVQEMLSGRKSSKSSFDDSLIFTNPVSNQPLGKVTR